MQKSATRASRLQALLELVQLVLELPHLLLGQGALLLAVLDLLLDVLDVLLLVLVAQRRALLHLDLVARAVVDLVGARVAGVLVVAVGDGLALDAEAPALHDPLLRRHAVAKLLVVGDDQHAALVVLDGEHQGAQALAVEVVRRLIQDQDVRLEPRAGREHDLHLLAAAQAAHARVRRHLGGQAHVGDVLLDVAGGERLLVHALARHAAAVARLHQLLEAQAAQQAAVHPLVHVLRHALEGGLVLVLRAALRLAAGLELLDYELDLLLDAVDLAVELDGRLDLGNLGVGEHQGLLAERLLVLAVAEAPHDVLRRGLLEVLLDVVEGVLGHVGDARAGVHPDGALIGRELAREQLDHGRLAGAVDANAGHAGAEGHAHRDVGERGLGVARVGEAHLVHLHEHLALAVDALQWSRLREVEGEGLGGQLEEGARLGGEALAELAQVAVVEVELEVLDLEHVRAALVEQAGVVADDDRGHVLEAAEVVLHPGHVEHVQVVGRLVHEQHVGVLEHGARERQLHAPATGQGGHGVVAHLVGEAHAQHGLLHLGAVDAGGLDGLVGEHVVQAAQVAHLALDVGLDAHVLLVSGQALDLAAGDGAQQRRLAAVVAAQQAVAGTALQLELRVVQQDARAVSEREVDVAQVLQVGVVLLLVLHVGGHLGALGADGSGGSHRVGGRQDGHGRQVGHDGGVPGRGRVHAHRGERGAQARDVGQLRHAQGDGGLRGHALGGGGGDGRRGALDRGVLGLLRVRAVARARAGAARGDGAGDGRARRGEARLDLRGEHAQHGGGVGARVRGLGVRGSADAQQLVARLLAHGTGLRVGGLLSGTLHGGQDGGQERRGVRRVVHELGHVGDDDRALAHDGRVARLHAAVQQRHHDRQGGRLDGLHEGERGQLVDGLGHLGGLLHGVHQAGQEGLQVAVLDDGAGGIGGLLGGRGHAVVQVVQQLREHRHEGRQVHAELHGRGLGQGHHPLEGGALGLVLAGNVLQDGHDGRHHADGGAGRAAQQGAERLHSLDGLRGGALVAVGDQGEGQVRHRGHEWLGQAAHRLAQAREHEHGALAHERLLLVGGGSFNQRRQAKVGDRVHALGLGDGDDRRDGLVGSVSLLGQGLELRLHGVLGHLDRDSAGGGHGVRAMPFLATGGPSLTGAALGLSAQMRPIGAQPPARV
mmetsp:Transcript_71171/g.197071  ORF Transcript_71171/g.197071 Transcript_71171/m.197071 type:complete len:1167 (-) Transcript_71171:43-3543(-)